MSPLLPKAPLPLTRLRPLLLSSLPRISHHQPHQYRPNTTHTHEQTQSLAKLLSLAPRIYDNHTHICDPVRFPVSKSATYRPHAAKLEDLWGLHRELGFDGDKHKAKIVLVQPSTYGLDNSCLLKGLEVLGPERGWGVVVVDPVERMKGSWEGKEGEIEMGKGLRELGEWWDRGVRGVRINLKSVGKTLSRNELEALIISYAKLLRAAPGGSWSLQIHADLASMVDLSSFIHHLSGICTICIDHFGCPAFPRVTIKNQPHDLRSLTGWEELKTMMRDHNVFVKISAPYRIAGARWGDIEALTKELLNVKEGKQVIWASDWPHTRFEGQVNVAEWVASCVQWCEGDEQLVKRLFWENARRMWEGEEEKESSWGSLVGFIPIPLFDIF